MKIHKNLSKYLIILLLTELAGCTWDSTAFDALYEQNDKGEVKERYIGPECDEYSLPDAIVNGKPLVVNRCLIHETCDNGKCAPTNGYCDCEIDANTGLPLDPNCIPRTQFEDAELNTNGFGYCLSNSLCLAIDIKNATEYGSDAYRYRCDVAKVSCTETDLQNCGLGATCKNGGCVCGDEICEGAEKTCCNHNEKTPSGCFNLKKDREHCGNCDESCKTGEICEEGKCILSCQLGLEACYGLCVNLGTDKDHCGECGRVCTEKAQLCVSGECVCPEGFTFCAGEGCVDLAATHRSACEECIDENWGNCDGDFQKNGCEVNLLTDTNNCKLCGESCPLGTFCSNGECSATCGGDLTKCTIDGVDSCYNLLNDALHCGSCDLACEIKDFATATCSSGSCLYACNVGYTNCASLSDPDCLDLNFDRYNCGSCGNNCESLPNVDIESQEMGCAAGICTFSCQEGYADCNKVSSDGCEVKLSESNREDCTTCIKHYANCDNIIENGCEVNTLVDNQNCGACGNKCGSGQVCSNGICSSTCIKGQTLCNNSCLTLSDMHLASCTACETNYCDNDDNKINGCEVELGTSPNHCGACNKNCLARPHATALCLSNTCTYICDTGYTNCGTNIAPNCINVKSTDANNCGLCGYKCADQLANVSAATCKAGVCQITACDKGYANCDKTVPNGCEINANENQNYCGSMNTCESKERGSVCTGGQICMHGKCQCAISGQIRCGNICVDTSNNNSHCGACNKPCPTGQVCSNGQCGTTCVSTQVLCDGKCIDPTSDNNHCSKTKTCGKKCGNNQKCTNGECKDIIACPATQTMCSGKCVDLQTDNNNCNLCGKKCSATQKCIDGACKEIIACTKDQVKCANKCIDPSTDITYCGAKGSCSGTDPNAGNYAGKQCISGNASAGYCYQGLCRALACKNNLMVCTNPSHQQFNQCVDPKNANTCGSTCKKCGNNQICQQIDGKYVCTNKP